ncbi:MAG: GTP cyclohydrolase I FolE [Cytophaga sp.]|uniref:GTP cyclohydrolase I FolE n=1 Tax=Cytophaga sp. TaxID=29535 RepID=UPI003F809C0B
MNYDEEVISAVFAASKTDKAEIEKIEKIRFYFSKIMETLGLDLEKESLKGTPDRVARMYVKEIFNGLNPQHFPSITLFDNVLNYEEMLVEKDITLYSYCEHHFVPIIGKVHIAYLPNEKIVGLSKLNRLVQFFASKPQVQENLTMELGRCLQEILLTENVAVYIEARHLCVASRGIKDTNSLTHTSFYGGKFKLPETKKLFLESIQ